ncbi:MAG: glutamine-hydrolyzing GMP synthase [Chitinophagales bacterium]|nr:glutamine-hydrolyzing GMP synthase [Chitinophagales bacterium]
MISRKIRELNVYCDMVPYNAELPITPDTKGIILTGSSFSVNSHDALQFPLNKILGKIPILGIEYGAQYIVKELKGDVQDAENRNYELGALKNIQNSHALLQGLTDGAETFLSLSDQIQKLPQGTQTLAQSQDGKTMAFAINESNTYGIQFHPEGNAEDTFYQIIKNFTLNICQCEQNWTSQAFVDEAIAEIRKTVGSQKVVLGLSGGVDSSVTALILHKAIGDQLTSIFIDHGLLRYNEFNDVLENYKTLGLNVIGIDASDLFLNALKGVSDPETKRKIIGKTFIDVFQKEAGKLKNVHWLGQGTIYPDIIESVSFDGSVKVKSHHNVGGLPEKMRLKLVEPLKYLFKNEVRQVGKLLQLPENILYRHPFPGPGLGVRILGDITREKVATLQHADHIFIQGLKKHGLYDKIWQAGVILLPVHATGVKDGKRTYGNVVALRAINSLDGMTAQIYPLPYDFFNEISSEIIYQVQGVNRVVFDISSKPPGTIEWE